MISLVNLDEQCLIYLNNLGDTAYDDFWLAVSHKLAWIPLYLYLLYKLFKQFGGRKIIWILVFIALGIGLSDQLSNLFKHGVARLRPCRNPLILPYLRQVTCGGKYGFFSAHAANCFFVATFFSFLMRQKMPRLKYILFPWAILVAYSRIYLGMHYPLDIIFGATFGYLVAGLSFASYCKVLTKTRK